MISRRHLLQAAGAAGALAGLPGEATVPVRPVKGQVLRLRDPRGPGLIERTIRGAEAYLVPRADGRYVLGATMEERGHDRTPTAGGLYELLRDMSEVVPGVLELEVEELRAGLRPATPDNLPAIGPGGIDGLHWAAGHFRNGILLTPVTAELAAAALAGEELPELAPGATVQSALAALDIPGAPRGVAVAVDAEVVPRGQWEAHQLYEGARIEVLRAIQGG